MKRFAIVPVLALLVSACQSAPEVQYMTVFGNTHSHCNYSGDIAKFKAKKGLSLDPKNTVDNHYRIAKENGYDFYCVTDHSQYPEYTQEAWKDIKAKAIAYTDAAFVGLRGYEHSENDGPDGTGHMNVYNSATFLNALADSVSIEFFHNWLARPENDAVIAGFNHPQINAYNDFACYNEEARDNFKIIELINGSKPRFYPSFLNALSKGWKVSPIAGCDNHATNAISTWTPRTGLAVERLTREGIFDAMRNRRTYATFDPDLKLIYYVNNHVMGSAFNTSSEELRFEISVSDPDKSSADARIRRIEITGASGATVKAGEVSEHDVEWKVAIPASKGCYFLKIYNFTSSEPVAYAAPVWVL